MTQHKPWGLGSWWIYHTAYALGFRQMADLSQLMPCGLDSWWIYHTLYPLGFRQLVDLTHSKSQRGLGSL